MKFYLFDVLALHQYYNMSCHAYNSYLKQFLENSQNNIKEHNVCVLCDNGSNNRNLVINELTECDISTQFVSLKFFERPTIDASTQILLIVDPKCYEFDNIIPHIKEYLNDKVIYRHPYTINTKANIIIVCKNLSFMDNFTDATKQKFFVVNI